MRTKKIALNMFFDIMPYLLIGVVGLIKVNYLIKYIGDVGNGYYQFITQLISYVKRVFPKLLPIACTNPLQKRIKITLTVFIQEQDIFTR